MTCSTNGNVHHADLLHTTVAVRNGARTHRHVSRANVGGLAQAAALCQAATTSDSNAVKGHDHADECSAPGDRRQLGSHGGSGGVGAGAGVRGAVCKSSTKNLASSRKLECGCRSDRVLMMRWAAGSGAIKAGGGRARQAPRAVRGGRLGGRGRLGHGGLRGPRQRAGRGGVGTRRDGGSEAEASGGESNGLC